MEMDIEQLRRGLRHPDTRSSVIDAAIDAGKASIEPLIQLLNDRNESVRWSAVRILSEVGDERAVGPLIALLERDKNVTEAANALRSITSQDFGEDPHAWRKWASGATKLDVSMSSHTMSDADLMTAATRDLPVVVHNGDRQYSIDVTLPGGRSQQVWVDFSRNDTSGQPIVQLCTPCGNANSRRYEWALKLNKQNWRWDNGSSRSAKGCGRF